MKEWPIIMSGNHPGLILDGIKTQTRQVIKPQLKFNGTDLNGKPYFIYKGEEYSLWALSKICPYGQVGDRLWVRESFFYGSGDYDSQTCNIRYATDNVEIKYNIPDGYSWDKTCKWCYTKLDGSHPLRPSIFMPRWASRILLEITEIRVERLQEITIKDCKREGIQYLIYPNENRTWEGEFERLWDSLNAKRGYGWETNPWVWVVSFSLTKEEQM